MEQKAFTWIEIETVQAPYLLQVTSELIAKLKTEVQKPEFKKPAWATNPCRQNRFTWNLFKKEMFGSREGEEEEVQPKFDDLEDEASSSEDEGMEIAANKTEKKCKKGQSRSEYMILHV